MKTIIYIEGDSETIKILDFETGKWRQIDTRSDDQSITGGHGGGDQGLIAAFLNALETEDFSELTSDSDSAVKSHMLVFAAEQARLTGKVVNIDEFRNSFSIT